MQSADAPEKVKPMQPAASQDEALEQSIVQPRDQRVGTLVAGRWLIESVLGAGGMATVYKAVHHRNGRQVALKVLHPELNEKTVFRERFLFEAYIGNKINHSGVVSALDDGMLADGTPYLVLEYLEGQSLQDLSHRRGQLLSQEEVSWFTVQLLDILEAVHASGVIHRDIKPENLFLTSDGSLKLLDFGIAKAEVEASQKTQLGITMGTPSFMSPEQARGRWGQVDEQSDLFSVAATMYVLLSGRVPHEAETTNEALLAAMTTEPAPIAQVLPSVHPWLAAIIDKGLAFSKRDRFESARTMKVALIQATGALQAPDDRFMADELPPWQSNQRTDAEITHSPVVTTDQVRELAPSHRNIGLFAAFLLSAAGGFIAVRQTPSGASVTPKPLAAITTSASDVPATLEPHSSRLEVRAETASPARTSPHPEASTAEEEPSETPTQPEVELTPVQQLPSSQPSASQTTRSVHPDREQALASILQSNSMQKLQAEAAAVEARHKASVQPQEADPLARRR